MPQLGHIDHEMDVGCDPVGRGGEPVDRRIARIAKRQHGVVARRQLAAIGLGRGAIEHRVGVGRLHVLHAGVYAVGHTRLSASAWRLAAVLACGPGAVLSHRTAADVLGILPSARRLVDVSSPQRTLHRHRGVVVHRPRRLGACDTAVIDGMPVTNASRTIVDLASVLGRARVSRAVEEAERRGVFDLEQVERLIVRGRRGAKLLRTVLRAYREPSFTRSGLERRFLALCRRAGLPPPATNLWIAGGEADAVWDEHALVVELDSRAFHGTPAAFERDRERDAALQLAGYRVLRVTDVRLEHEPAEVARTVAGLLAAR